MRQFAGCVKEPYQSVELPREYQRLLVLDFLGRELAELPMRARVHAVVYSWTRFNLLRPDLALRQMSGPRGSGPGSVEVSGAGWERIEASMQAGAPTRADKLELIRQHNSGGDGA